MKIKIIFLLIVFFVYNINVIANETIRFTWKGSTKQRKHILELLKNFRIMKPIKKPEDMVNYMAINDKTRKSMKKIFLILLFQINLLSAESQSLYEDEFVKVNLSFDTSNENIILQISNISDKTIYLYKPTACIGYHTSYHYINGRFVVVFCLNGHTVNPLTPPLGHRMFFRRLLEKESDTIVFNKYKDSVKIDLNTFILDMEMEYLPLPKDVYIEDGECSNYSFLEYIREEGYKIRKIEPPLLVIDNSVDAEIRPIIKSLQIIPDE